MMSLKYGMLSLLKKRARSFVYFDEAIHCAMIINAVFKLPFRALQGFMLSMIGKLGLSLGILCYTRIGSLEEIGSILSMEDLIRIKVTIQKIG